MRRPRPGAPSWRRETDRMFPMLPDSGVWSGPWVIPDFRRRSRNQRLLDRHPCRPVGHSDRAGFRNLSGHLGGVVAKILTSIQSYATSVAVMTIFYNRVRAEIGCLTFCKVDDRCRKAMVNECTTTGASNSPSDLLLTNEPAGNLTNEAKVNLYRICRLVTMKKIDRRGRNASVSNAAGSSRGSDTCQTKPR